MTRQLRDLKIGQDIELNIYSYSNPYKFLSDYIKDCKAISLRYSYRFFGKRLGYASSSTMKNIIKEKRELKPKVISTISSMMSLDVIQERYFTLLLKKSILLKNKIQTGYIDKQEYQEITQQLRELRQANKERKILNEADCKILSSLMHLIILEMAQLSSFHPKNPQWITKALLPHVKTFLNGVPGYKSQIPQISDDLIKNKFLLQTESGEWAAKDELFDFENEEVSQMLSKSLKNFHKEILQLGVRVLESPVKQKERMHDAGLVATTPAKFSASQKRIAEFIEQELNELKALPGEASIIAACSVQLFKVAKTTD